MTGGTTGHDQADYLISFACGASAATYAYIEDDLCTSKTVGGTSGGQGWDMAEAPPLLAQDGAVSHLTGPSGLPLKQVTADGGTHYY